MSESVSERSPRERQLDAIIVEYYNSVEQGQPVNQEKFLQDHPEFAAELRDFFADVGQIEQVVPAVRPELEETQPPDGAFTTHRSPGTKVQYLGDYEILEELGAGGMGVVYKARQSKLKKIVALKMIKVGQLASDEEVRRFQAEARAAAKLDHPGIVAVHEVGVDHRQHYYAMDYVAGGSLSALHREGPVAARQAAELVKKLADAMHYAHGQGIVHRDLKPANVLLTTSGVPRITDFGLAKRLWSDDDSAGLTMTETGQVLGTAGYMSPEQAAGKTRLLGPPADIYSLGAILYALLTSRAPFVGESQADTILQVIQKEPVSPRTLNPSVPRDLETICLKCLEKEPHKRYGTAQLLADDLARSLENKPVLARPVSSVERTWRWCQRNPWAATALALLVLLAVGSPPVALGMYQLAADKDIALIDKDKALVEKGKALVAKDKALFEKQDALKDAEGSLKTARWNTYVAKFYNLTTSWKNQQWGDLDLRLAELTPAPGQPDFRGWEWYYFRDQYDHHVKILSDRTQQYVFVRFSPNGKLLALRRKDKGIEVWDMDRLAKLIDLPGEHNVQVAWNPEGTLLAAHQHNTVRIFNVQTSQEVDVLTGAHPGKYEKNNYGLDWSDDGQRIALAGGGWVEIWEASGKHKCTAVYNAEDSDDSCQGLSWHPDGKRLALSTQAGIARVLDADTEKWLWAKRICNIGTTDAQWSLDGTRLAVGAHFPVFKTLILDETGRQVQAFESRLGGYFTVGWNSAGTHMVTRAEDEHTAICDVATGKVLKRLHLHSSPVSHVAWRPGADEIVSVGEDGGFRVWRVDVDFHQAIEIPFHVTVRALTWHPQQPLLAAAGGVEVFLFDAETGKLAHRWKGHKHFTYAVDWHPDGKRLASLDVSGEIRIWNLATGETERTLDAGSSGIAFFQMQFSPNGRYLACGSNESAKAGGKCGVRVFDLDNRGAEIFFDPRYRGTLAWSPDSRFLVTGSYSDGVVKMWNVAESRLVWSERHSSVVHAAFRPDGKQVATAHKNGTLQLRNASDGALMKTEHSHSQEVSRVFWSPEGARIATMSHDGILRIWDAATGDEMLGLTAHTDFSNGLCWSPNGTQLATGGRDQFIRIWGSSQIRKSNKEIDFDERGTLVTGNR